MTDILERYAKGIQRAAWVGGLDPIQDDDAMVLACGAMGVANNGYDLAIASRLEWRRQAEVAQATLKLAEGGLLLLLDAVKAGDPQREIVWRIEEELRQIRRTGPTLVPQQQQNTTQEKT